MTQSVQTIWIVIICMVAGGVLYRCLWGLCRKWKVNRRFRRGLQAEKNAIRFLRHRGYQILAAQLQETIVVYVDGQPEKITVRADFWCCRGWKTYIVEVKSGQQGSIRLPNVRRQLLEYKLVYQPDGILLLDMEHHTLQEIRFSYPDKKRYRLVYYSLFFLLLGLGIYSILPVF